jgi:hypothetical protein
VSRERRGKLSATEEKGKKRKKRGKGKEKSQTKAATGP